jgi:hypothetical protein
MNSFKEEITANEPSIRVGNVLPENTVNLAYINGPELLSDDSVELYDYSKQVPENTVILDNFKADFHVNSEGILSTGTGNALVPVENVLVTNYYKELPDKQWVPLYYHYRTRFKHYEKEPPYEEYSGNNVNNDVMRVYLGNNIRVLLNGVPTTENYIACLEIDPEATTPVDGSDPLTWIVHVFSEFSSSESKYYTVEYSKWDATNSVARHNYEEILNTEPIFEKTDKDNVESSDTSENKFCAEKLFSEDGYRILVSDETVPLNRIPVLIRWRAKENGGKYSTWKSDTILRGLSLYDEDYGDSTNPNYIIEDGITKKVLCSDVTSLFQSSIAPYTIEWQLWNADTSEWENYALADIEISLDSLTGRVTGVTTRNTGEVIEAPGEINYQHPNTQTAITIEGWLDPPDITINPVIITNLSKSSKGATISCPLSSAWPYYTSPSQAIDGTNPGWALLTGSLLSAFYVRSEESETPPTSTVTATVAFGRQATAIKRVEIVMGSKGIPVKLELRDGNGVWHTLWNSAPTYGDALISLFTGREFVYNSSTGILGATHLRVTIQPSTWYTRRYVYKRHWFHKHYRNLYQSGFDLFEINAYDHYDPPDVERNWYKKITLGLNVTKSSPITFSMKEFLASSEMIPDDPEVQDSLANLHYRVTLGDLTDLYVTPIPDYSPYISATAFKQIIPDWAQTNFKGLLQQMPSDNNTVYFRYNDAMLANTDVKLVISSCKEEASFSRRFSVMTEEDSKIFIKSFGVMNKDEMWFPSINNGRFSRKNLTSDTFLDYYIPEYGSQPFYPSEPYMYVEREIPEYIDGTTIRVKYKPLHVTYDINGSINNLNVYLDNNGVLIAIPVISWNMYTGDIMLDRKINTSDDIYVDYFYRCNHLIYKGCTFKEIKTKDILVNLIAGDNTIKFWHALSATPTDEECVPDIDKIEIIPSVGEPVILEAESQYNLLSGTATISNYSLASEGKIVTNIKGGENNFIQFNQVNVPSSDTYTMRVYYRADGDIDDVSIVVNEGVAMNEDFSSTSIFHYLDLNTMPGHVYLDDLGIQNQSAALFDKNIWLYVIPVFVLDYSTGETIVNDAAIYHRILDKNIPEYEVNALIKGDNPVGTFIIGKIEVKRPAIPAMISVTDARRYGGGIKENISKESLEKEHMESLYTWDIGSWDGMPYPSNGVIEITLPESLLKEYGGNFTREEIEGTKDSKDRKEPDGIINQHVAFGVYVFVQYKK